MQNSFLEFTKSYFDKMGIQTHIVNIREPLPLDLDMGLRKTILNKRDAETISFKGISDSFTQEKIIYYAADIYNCSYILLPVPEQELPIAMILGPYLVESPGIQRTQEICRKHNIPEGLWQFINQYYTSLTYVENISTLESYVETLAETIYGAGNFRIEYIRQKNTESEIYLTSANSTSNENTMQQLEHRYDLEEKVMDAISGGNFDRAMHYSSDIAFRGLDNRSSNTLRSKKNNLLAFNTLCRKAAERGKVHPVHLDEMSRRMAIRIENMTTPTEDKEVHREILKKYCLLVQQQSTAGYSPVMQKILNHISQKLSEPELTLQETAEDLGLNKSYLASLFKKETGSTFTGFVNKKRVERAIFLLNTSDYSVHTIASICGMNDMTYFNRVFKKEKGITPTQYRKMIRQE
ncbi:response regulator (CheY-like receiver domain and AraC-type DNA-binding domain-containing protein) [Lachnospiraceae bacterium JC7]|nr:response regulator (CheY-like receiver domain and AraC-type DNA-binding domain-containing protein) [Lachnospiraceae bacterium JC7]